MDIYFGPKGHIFSYGTEDAKEFLKEFGEIKEDGTEVTQTNVTETTFFNCVNDAIGHLCSMCQKTVDTFVELGFERNMKGAKKKLCENCLSNMISKITELKNDLDNILSSVPNLQCQHLQVESNLEKKDN